MPDIYKSTLIYLLVVAVLLGALGVSAAYRIISPDSGWQFLFAVGFAAEGLFWALIATLGFYAGIKASLSRVLPARSAMLAVLAVVLACVLTLIPYYYEKLMLALGLFKIGVLFASYIAPFVIKLGSAA